MLSRKLEADLLGDDTEATIGEPRTGRLASCHEGLYVRTSCRETSFKAVLLWPSVCFAGTGNGNTKCDVNQ